MGGGSVHDVPLYTEGLALLLQVPDVGTQPGTVPFFDVPEVRCVFIPSLFKCTSGEASIVLRTIRGGDTGNINHIILPTLRGGEGAIGRSSLAVATLDCLMGVITEQLGIVAADQAAHVGHALVRHLDCVSVQQLPKWIVRRERGIDYP